MSMFRHGESLSAAGYLSCNGLFAAHLKAVPSAPDPASSRLDHLSSPATIRSCNYQGFNYQDFIYPVPQRSRSGLAHQTEAAKNFLGADDRRCDLRHREPLLRGLLTEQLVRLRLADLLERDENLDCLVDITSGFQGFLELLNLALESFGVAVDRARQYERGQDTERADRLVDDAVRVAVEQALQHRRIFIIDDRYKRRTVVQRRGGKGGRLRGFHEVKDRIDIPGQFHGGRPHATNVATDALQLIDQRISFGVAWMDHEDSRSPQILHQAANSGLHRKSGSSLIQRAPSGVTAR